MEPRGARMGRRPDIAALPTVTLRESDQEVQGHERGSDLRRRSLESERRQSSQLASDRLTRDARAEQRMTRFRRGFAWVVVGLLVFMLVATLLLGNCLSAPGDRDCRSSSVS